jgi:predicted acetyltransferase
MKFFEYLQILNDYENGRNLPEGRVADTTLFGFWGNEIVGQIALRHELNDFLSKIGEHIGYRALSENRRKGFATSMLLQILPLAKSMGL